jgi:hypothetical protein
MNHAVKLFAAISISCLTFAFPALAIEDTPENRAAQADYYLRVVPAQTLMNDMSEKIAATLPESQRPIFITLMTKNLDMNAVANLMRAAMIKNFSADELKAIADFYGSPIGKSAMTKYGNYMADAMGPLQVELARAMTTTQEQMQTK